MAEAMKRALVLVDDNAVAKKVHEEFERRAAR
jgi:hypothetical protein